MMTTEPTDIFFGDDDYPFAFGWPEIEELERVTNKGIPQLLQEFASGLTEDTPYRWTITDVKNTIRVGLVGGGMNPKRAKELVETYLLKHGLTEARIIAMEAFYNLFGSDEDAENGNRE